MKTFFPTKFWNFLIWSNLALSCILLIGMYSDYQFENQKANFVLPLVVSIMTIFLLWKTYRSNWESRRPMLIVSLIPLVISLPYFLSVIICLIPFFTCRCAFELEHLLIHKGIPILLQSELSSDNAKTAEVYYSEVKGDNASGGYLDVYVKYHFLPFVNRKVHEVYTPKSYNDFKNPIVEWTDDNTIVFINTQVLDIGIIGFQSSQIFTFFKYLFQ